MITKLFDACSFYSESGTDELSTKQLEMMDKEAVAKLAEQSAKTMSIEEFNQYISNFKSVQEPLLKFNYSASTGTMKVKQAIKK
jgi:hypothetical protein